jgi:hypothetical protein
MRWPSWDEFKKKIVDVEQYLSELQVSFGDGFEKFQDRHPMIYDAIQEAGRLLPPPVNGIVEHIYKKYGSNGKEKATLEVLEYLESIKTMSEENYRRIRNELEEIKIDMAKTQDVKKIQEILISQGQILNERLYYLETSVLQGTSDILFALDGGQKNTMDSFEKISKRLEVYDYENAASRLTFYLELNRLLEIARRIFLNQNDLAKILKNNTDDKRLESITVNGNGLDERLCRMHPHMTEEEKKEFDLLRKITDDTYTVNHHMKVLLQNNKEFRKDSIDMEKLYDHLCWYVAKYQIFKDDPDTYLIYLDPPKKWISRIH